ncbi:MAG: TonB-dependent receptor [Mucilaginibacter sp.]|uniref:TonB-dependent receptor n=1 Tax=Mucilaginibacter sp. TaxID=1882438 RepID=UPI003267D14F
MKKLILLFTFLLTIAFKGYSQTGREVHGVVADSTGITIPGVVVKLTSPTDSLNVVTNVDGVFTFTAVKSKQFALTILSIGYQGLKRNYTFDGDNKPANIGTIKLKTETRMLNTVQITDVNAVKVTTDTTEYKASAYPVRANAPVEDVLKKLPGVDVDKDGNVTAEGKAVNKVRINGKDFFGGDVKTATKNLPADVIESIQMIDDYGDQANLTGLKTGEPNKIMNIVIRKDKNYGYSLSATGGDGSDALPKNPGVTNSNRYVGAINSFKFNGDQQIALLGSINNTNINTFSFSGGGGGGGGRGQRLGGGGNTPTNGITDAKSLGLNYRDQWGKTLSVYGSYSFADNSVYTANTQIQRSLDGSFVNNSTGNNIDGTLNHRINWNMEWKPDTINYLKFTPTFAYASTTTDDASQNSISTSGLQSLLYNSKTVGNSSSPSYGGNVLYNHRFNGHGRNFSLNLSANSSPSDVFSNPITTYIVGSPGGLSRVPANQLINTNTTTNSESISASYIEPLSTVSYLEANYNFNRAETNTNRTNDTVTVSGQQNFYDRLSNNYNFTYTTNKFGLNYRLIEKNYNLTLGAGVQPGLLDGVSPATQTYPAITTHVSTFNFIPTARFVYNFSRSQALNINYNGSSSQPSYSQLNPRPDLSDPTYIVTGNPGLQPEFNNNFSIRYNKFSFGTGNVLFTNLSFTQTNNKIVTNVNTIGNVQSVDYRNTDGYYSANGFFTYAKPWAQRKYTLILNGNANYTNNIGFNNNVKNISKQLTFTPGLRFRVDITDVIDVQASANYAVTSTDNTNAQLNSTYKTTTLGLNGKNYFWTNWTLSYDFSKAINQGYSTGTVTNPNILNTYVERRFLKNNMATIRLAAYDLFNQNTGYTNTPSGNYIVEQSVNRLGRYFLATLTIRLQKFAGKAPDQGGMPGERRMRKEGGGGQGGPGGGFGGPQ